MQHSTSELLKELQDSAKEPLSRKQMEELLINTCRKLDLKEFWIFTRLLFLSIEWRRSYLLYDCVFFFITSPTSVLGNILQEKRLQTIDAFRNNFDCSLFNSMRRSYRSLFRFVGHMSRPFLYWLVTVGLYADAAEDIKRWSER